MEIRTELPKDWQLVPLGSLATDLLSGGTPSTKRPDYWSGTIPWITSKWLGEPLRLSSGEKFISSSALADSASNVVPAGNLIYATRVGVGKVVVNDIEVAINQDLAGILVDASKALPDFLAYQLRTNRVKSYVEGNKRGATIQGITQACLREIEIALPPLQEQRQIAAVLSAVQRAIERQERLIVLTAELKKVLMHNLFTEGTRGEPLKQTEIGPMPANWRMEPLGEHLTTAQYGLSVKKADDGVTPMLRMTNQVDGRIVANDLQRVNISSADLLKFKVEPGDVLFNRTNSHELVGRTAIFDLEGGFVFASYLIRLRCQTARLRPTFLNHYFNCSAVQARLKGIASRAVSQSNISASRLRGFLVPLPTPEEQDEIGDSIDGTDRVRSVLQRELSVLQELFRTLLHGLMTTEIRVADLDLSALEEAAQAPVGAV